MLYHPTRALCWHWKSDPNSETLNCAEKYYISEPGMTCQSATLCFCLTLGINLTWIMKLRSEMLAASLFLWPAHGCQGWIEQGYSGHYVSRALVNKILFYLSLGSFFCSHSFKNHLKAHILVIRKQNVNSGPEFSPETTSQKGIFIQAK